MHGWLVPQRRRARCARASLNPFDNIGPPFANLIGRPVPGTAMAARDPPLRCGRGSDEQGALARTLHASLPALVARGSFVILLVLVRGAIETRGRPEWAVTGFVASTEFVLGSGLDGGGM